jgi:hypothetical protein
MNDETVYLRERHVDDGVAYVEVWLTPPPAEGVLYRVVRDDWVDDYTERRIYEIKLVPTA